MARPAQDREAVTPRPRRPRRPRLRVQHTKPPRTTRPVGLFAHGLAGNPRPVRSSRRRDPESAGTLRAPGTLVRPGSSRHAVSSGPTILYQETPTAPGHAAWAWYALPRSAWPSPCPRSPRLRGQHTKPPQGRRPGSPLRLALRALFFMKDASCLACSMIAKRIPSQGYSRSAPLPPVGP